jgi:translocation and assembly module TamA
VEIHPGEPVRVERVEVTVVGPGAREKVLQEQIRGFPLRRGDVLRQDFYEQAKGKLKAQALDLGYLDADFTAHRLGIDLESNQSEVELTLATGEQYRFAETLIHGAPDYPDPFLRRYLAFAEGEAFSYSLLGKTQLNYLNSDRFRDVVITPRPELARDRQVPVGIQLVPSARRKLRPGIGYGTDTGARISLRYKDVNIFHRGHEFSTEFDLAERKQALTAEFIMPSYRKLSDYFALRTGYNREDIDTYESASFFVEGEVVRAFGGGRLGSVYLRLLREDFTIGEEDSISRLLLPGLRFAERHYDDPVRPRRGYQYRLEVRGTHQVLGSDTGLLQALVSANTLQPLPGGFSLFVRGQAGATWQNEPLREIPPSLRFFAGGDQSVRGYGYQELGPRDSNDEVVGGKNLLVGSVELERAVSENWGVAVFYDAGNAFDSFSDYEIFQGAGLGVRRYTPVGPVKVDLARQVGVPDPSIRLHVSIGFTW